jgi:ribonuclease P protein component
VQRRNRLSRSRDFDAVYRHGRSVSTRFLTLWWYVRDEAVGAPRLGFAVPKSVGNAVVRNRIKRRFRALAHDILPVNGVAGADHVLIGRADGLIRDFALLKADLAKALAKVSR